MTLLRRLGEVAGALAGVVICASTSVGAQASAGRPLQQLLSEPGLDIDPVYSPDRKNLLFSSTRGGSLEVWMRSLAGGGFYQITTSVAGSADRFPTMTPDGKAIVFQSDRGTGVRNVWWLALDNRGLTQLTSFTDGGASHPSLSPDGRAICFTRTSAAGGLSIWIIDTNGRNAREVAPGVDCAWVTNTQIVFARASGGENPSRFDIATMDIDGRSLRVLTPASQSWVRSPRISPDGKRLVYTAYPGAFTGDIREVPGGMQVDPALRTSIWLLDLAVLDPPPTELIPPVSFNSFAVWSQDSRTIAFTSNRGGSADVWAVGVDP